jgi:hypothetical protein
MKYEKSTFQCLFPAYPEALDFSQDPWFDRDNQHQNGTTTVIAKAPNLPFLVVFDVYHDPADTEVVTTIVRELTHQYGGVLDGDPAPFAEPAAPATPVAEPAPPVEPAVPATPWS